jgi:hypothetical protein
MARPVLPTLFPNLVNKGGTIQNIVTVSQHEDALVVVYRTHKGYCGFVVTPAGKARFLEENSGVCGGIDRLKAEWRDFLVRRMQGILDAHALVTEPGARIVSFGVRYLRHGDDEEEGDPGLIATDRAYAGFVSNKSLWENYTHIE